MWLMMAMPFHRSNNLISHLKPYFSLCNCNSSLQGKVTVHGGLTALAWLGPLILATGSDQKLVFYSAEGRPVQQLDYSRSKDEHEITTCVASSCGQMVALGSFDK